MIETPESVNVLRIREVEVVRPLHVVIICLVAATIGGGLLLLSAAEPVAPVDGAIDWQEESPLRAVVQLLCLNYQSPTYYAGGVKNYILGIGAGLVMLVVGLAVVVRARTEDEEGGGRDVVPASSPADDSFDAAIDRKAHVAPLIAAQVLAALYLLWSFASTRWSHAAQLSLGGSILLAVQFFWSFGLGNGLNPTAARITSRVVIIITAMTAAVAIWYHYGRNPTIRADFPVGNPAFLGACLIPGILLAAGMILQHLMPSADQRRTRALTLIGTSLLAIALCVWAMLLADSRSSYVGLCYGALGMAFFAWRGRARLIPVVLAIALAIGGWLYVARATDAFSPTGRSATLRLRAYAWDYAWQLFNARPVTGHGQGGFVLLGDSYVANDVLNDPLVFGSRIAHAHNEWLEVLADLGSVGLVLIAAALILTLRAGMAALAARPPPAHRWVLTALMGALVGLIVEESFGVGLRVSGVPTVFYTVVGLIWAMSAFRMAGLVSRLSVTRTRRIWTGVVGGVLGVGALLVTQQDYTAARNVFRATVALDRGDHEEAIRLATAASGQGDADGGGGGLAQLNPQRALTNLFRLSEAHLRAARVLQARAIDRGRRAGEMEPRDRRLLLLAQEDGRLSDEHCKLGSRALRDLVGWSPGFINHGRLGYWLNLTRARNAVARRDEEAELALLKDAGVAIKRELSRQPFDQGITVDYIRVAGATLDFPVLIELFARPLRHNRFTESYLELVRELAADPDFDRHFAPLLAEAIKALDTMPDDREAAADREIWAPEKLRLAATAQFVRGEYNLARTLLERAAPVYERLATSAPLAAASCYAELAICRFFSDPTAPRQAYASAVRAIALAPVSRQGRQLTLSVKSRMVEYLLADQDEERARALLKEIAPWEISDVDLTRELGARYVRMCESILGRREAGGLLRKPPEDMVPMLQAWSARSIELNPGDPQSCLLAADFAFYVGDDVAAVAHLRRAMENGLPMEQARAFVQTARDRAPDSLALRTLWSQIAPLIPGDATPGHTPTASPDRRGVPDSPSPSPVP